MYLIDTQSSHLIIKPLITKSFGRMTGIKRERERGKTEKSALIGI